MEVDPKEEHGCAEGEKQLIQIWIPASEQRTILTANHKKAIYTCQRRTKEHQPELRKLMVNCHAADHITVNPKLR